MTLYSHSRLSTFEKCRKQFELRYLLQVPQETEGIEAFVGKRVHEVLERLYDFVARRQVPSLRKVVERYHALFDDAYDPDRVVVVKEGLDVDHYRRLGVRCLENHYRDRYPFDQEETLGLEERLVFGLDASGRYKVQGIVDRIVRARDGAIEIQDYKTGEYVPSQKKLDEDRQLALYQIGVAERYGADQPIRLVWHYLSRGKRCESTRTPEQLEALKRETVDLIDRIERAEEFPTTRTNLCAWCSYKPICPAFGAPESAAAEAAAAARRSAGAPAPDDAQLRLL
jgi:putative RecB family exonuclease